MIQAIIKLLDEKKAENPCHINIKSNDYVASDVILATSLTGKHASSMLNELKKLIKLKGGEIFAVDDENDEWIVIDSGSLMIHIMTQAIRDRFKLEEFLEKQNQQSQKQVSQF